MPLRTHGGFAFLIGILTMSGPAAAQVGQITAAIGEGSIVTTDETLPWHIGSSIEEDTEIKTQAGGYAMLFFVSGMGAADIEFDGVIVLEVDQNTHIRVQSARRSAIDIHILQGAVRAFFDAREHGEYLILSTPLGRMQVSGSEIYASHDLDDAPGSVFGTFDSPCAVTIRRPDGNASFDITQLQKVVMAAADAEPQVMDMRQADRDYWDAMPDFNLHSAMVSSGRVSRDYADRAWVGEYVVSDERLEDVARQGSSNIPTQEPIVTNIRAPVLLQAIALAVLARGASQPQGLREVRDGDFDRPVTLTEDGRGVVIIAPVGRTTQRVQRELRQARVRPRRRR